MHPGLLVGAGFVLGTAGLKALKSETAHKAYVHTIAQGLRLKEEAESLVDEAKAEFDDILAEAGYEKANEEEAEDAEQPKLAEGEAAPEADADEQDGK